MIIRDIPNAMGTLLYYESTKGIFDHPLHLIGGYNLIPLVHLVTGIILGIILIAFRTPIAKYIVPDSNDKIELTSRHIENIAFIAFPAWLVIDTFINIIFYGVYDSYSSAIRLLIGLGLLIAACFYVWKQRN